MDHDASSLVGQVISDRYRVIELLGQGGMGAVYRADHVHIRKSFALKVLHRELTHHSEAVKRFEREAIAAARIDHPNVATAIDFGRLESGAFFLVLDYVQGRSLRQLLNDEGRIPESRACRVARQIASALAAAHAAGIVHRDLKPDNVMLVESGSEPDCVKVLDFGIAKLRTEDIPDEPAITRFGTVFGTPEYMSPEQSLGQTVDSRSDLYALGILLYEMLVGHTPFADEQLVIVLTRQMTEPPRPLPESVSAPLRHLVMQLLEKQPDARPANADLVIAALDTIGPASSEQRVNLGDYLDESSQLRQDRREFAIGATVFADGRDASALAPSPNRTAPEATSNPFAKTAALSSIRAPSLPPWIRKQVVIAGRHVPLVLVAMGAALVLGGVMGTFGVWAILGRSVNEGQQTQSGPTLANLLGESTESREIRGWIEQAMRGDAVALRRLEEQAESTRSADVWAAIGAGRAMAKQWSAAVDAYNHALSTDPRIATSKHTQSDLYQASLDAQASASALEAAAQYLGTAGADLIFAALETGASGRTSKVDRRKAKSLLESSSVNSQLSAALRIALKLDAARSCTEYRSLLAEAAATGDQRCQRVLKKLTYDRGCGLLDLQDCYSCLRGSRALSAALDAVKSRPSPTFAPALPESAPAGVSR